jgi:hypothetical protein
MRSTAPPKRLSQPTRQTELDCSWRREISDAVIRCVLNAGSID